MKQWRWWTLLILLVLSTLDASGAQNEAIAFGVDNGTGSGSCEIGDDLNHFRDAADRFDEVFDDWIASGKWDSSRVYKNGGLDAEDVTDAAKKAWGQDTVDPNGIDHADVAMIATHGDSNTSLGWTAFGMGDPSGQSCTVRTDEHMKFGNGDGNDLEVLIALACNSSVFEVWSKDGVRGDDEGYDEVTTSSGGFNTWMGFHGSVWDRSSVPGHVEDYLRNSYYNGLGDNWLDEMHYRVGIYIQCPTVAVYADSAANCDDVYEDGGIADRNEDGTGSKTKTKFYYFKNCNPHDGSRLPND